MSDEAAKDSGGEQVPQEPRAFYRTEPPARLTVVIQMERCTAAEALGTLEVAKDEVRAFHLRAAREAAKAKPSILIPGRA